MSTREDSLKVKQESLEKELAFVVSSCDSYQDLWQPYFTFLFRYWPDCPLQVYLIANKIRFSDARVQTILTDEDGGWAVSTRRALLQISHPYILYTHEDFFPDRLVSTERIVGLLEYMKRRGAGYLRLYPSPGPDKICEDFPSVGEILKGSEYRTSLQAAIWNREVMLSLLKDGENAWQMERDGSVRSNQLDIPFLSAIRDPITNRVVDPPLSYFCTGVYKGRWMREAVKFCEREGVAIDLSARPVETRWIELRRTLSPIIGNLLAPLLWFRRWLRSRKAVRSQIEQR